MGIALLVAAIGCSPTPPAEVAHTVEVDIDERTFWVRPVNPNVLAAAATTLPATSMTLCWDRSVLGNEHQQISGKIHPWKPTLP
jgi:hypothetical protein